MTPAFAAPAAAAPATAPQPPGFRTRAYLEARRHSRLVRLLKIAIPVGSGLAGAAILFITIFNPFGRVGFAIGPVSVQGTRIAMQSPRLTGYKKDMRGYEVTAVTAYRDIRQPSVIELKDMKARMAMDDHGAVAHLTAVNGVFDTARDHLDLHTEIRVTTDDGREALLRSASVEFKTGSVVSNEPVRVFMKGGTVQADSMNVVESGKSITFAGRVHTVMERDEQILPEPKTLTVTTVGSAAAPPSTVSLATASAQQAAAAQAQAAAQAAAQAVAQAAKASADQKAEAARAGADKTPPDPAALAAAERAASVRPPTRPAPKGSDQKLTENDKRERAGR